MDKARTAMCSCGKLRAICKGEPVRISVCHCPACQRRTGSAFGVQARYPESSVTVEGAYSTWIRHVDDGDEVIHHFCPICGATVVYRIQSIPGFFGIPVGGFADPKFPSPKISIWEDAKHPWVSLPQDIEHID